MNAVHHSSDRPALPAVPTTTVDLSDRRIAHAGRVARRRTSRRGAAVVELAVVTPLLLLMMFGIMEFGLSLMHRESLTNAVREACRVRVLKGATDAEAKTRFASAMTGTGMTVSPSAIAVVANTQASGDIIYTVTASVPRSSLSVFGLTSMVQRFMQMFSSGASLNPTQTVVVTCSMRGES